MKRKDVHDIIDDDFCFPPRSRKFMRTDGGDLLSIMEEDPSTRVPLPLQNQGRPLPTPTTINAQSNAPFIDTNTMPSSQDKAIVLYKSPTSPDFSIIINSDFFPGLKDHLFWPQDSWTMKSIEDKATDNGSSGEPNDRLAVVPWVAPQLRLASGTGTGITVPLQPMEAEAMEGEMMDTDDNSDSNIAGKAFQDGEMVEGAEAFELWQQEQQQQKQHYLMPQLSQNIYTPVT
ncbi:hypothetical protein CRYUN_Cryun03dG0062300 [Craigia yunnanensis]